MSPLVDELIEAIKGRVSQKRSSLSEFLDLVSTRSIANEEVIRWLKAVHEFSISPEDTAFLTHRMMKSGKTLKWNEGIIVDKHSTGGVGDKMSLILAPLLACMGLRVPMLAGRGLGHTGGTIDKLESIQGFRTNLSSQEIEHAVANVGCCISAQSSEIAPADALLYALRDISGTIDSIPLITASIISKKAAEGLNCLVLDVKCGKAAFMKNIDDAKKLAESMQSVAEMLGIKCVAQITEMDNPIGDYIGNSLEVIESILIMKGEEKNSDCLDVVLMQAYELAKLADISISDDDTYHKMFSLISDGSVLRKFVEMCVNQGVDSNYMMKIVEDPNLLLGLDYVDIISQSEGYIAEIDSLALANIARRHKAGRFEFGQEINPSTGFIIDSQPGKFVNKGNNLTRFYYDYQPSAEEIQEIVSAFKISSEDTFERNSRLMCRI